MILAQLLYTLFCIGLAYDNSLRIKKGKKISHNLNGALHLVIASLAVWAWGLFGIVFLFIGAVVFDVALNLWRNLGIFYTPLKPESLVDRLERKVFGTREALMKGIYLGIIIGLNILK